MKQGRGEIASTRAPCIARLPAPWLWLLGDCGWAGRSDRRGARGPMHFTSTFTSTFTSDLHFTSTPSLW